MPLSAYNSSYPPSAESPLQPQRALWAQITKHRCAYLTGTLYPRVQAGELSWALTCRLNLTPTLGTRSWLCQYTGAPPENQVCTKQSKPWGTPSSPPGLRTAGWGLGYLKTKILRSYHGTSWNPGHIHMGEHSKTLEFMEVEKARSDHEQLKVRTLEFIWFRTGSPSAKQK